MALFHSIVFHDIINQDWRHQYNIFNNVCYIVDHFEFSFYNFYRNWFCLFCSPGARRYQAFKLFFSPHLKSNFQNVDFKSPATFNMKSNMKKRVSSLSISRCADQIKNRTKVKSGTPSIFQVLIFFSLVFVDKSKRSQKVRIANSYLYSNQALTPLTFLFL